jgi:selenocysteine lyase/cysteine desulfurase
MRSADFDDGAGIDAYLKRVGMASGGAVRVSLGLATNFADVSRFLAFARGFRDLATIREHLPPRQGC